jgi:hypothetical protein
MSLLVDQALRLADDGLPVFPCRSNKAPACPGGFKDATTDPDEIEKLFAHRSAKLIGLPTGKASRIVVVDIDVKNGKDGRQWPRYQDLPRTKKVQTTSGGDHFYFKHPGLEIKSRANVGFNGLDIRGDGGARKKGFDDGVELTPPPAVATDVFKSWQPTDANDIPPRDFLFGRHYIRKFVSGTVAQGGVGKSTLALFEAIAMAARMIEYGCKDSDLVVAYFNAEDPLDEIRRRIVAICQHAHIDQRDLVDRLFIASGRDAGVVLAEGEQGIINEKVFDFLGKMIDQTGADVLVLDPLANMTTSPETNEVFRLFGARLSALANEKDISIEIIHHTRKLQPGGEANHEDARKGSALVNEIQPVRVLNNMTSAEAHKAGLETHVDHFRVDDGKANLARRAERASWWRKVSVELANGDHVAAIEPWQWPDFSDHFTAIEISRALDLIAVERDNMNRRAYPTSEGWGGEIICGVKADGLEKIDAVEAAAWREAAGTKDAKVRSPLANQYHAATKTLLADLGNGGYLEIVTAQDKRGYDRKCLQRTEKNYEVIEQSGG